MAGGDPSGQHCCVRVANEQVDDGLARRLVDMQGDDLGLAVLRSAGRSIAVAAGVTTTRTWSPECNGKPGACAGVSATPTTDWPCGGSGSSETTRAGSAPPAAISSAARWPTTWSNLSADTGGEGRVGAEPDRCEVLGSMTEPRSMRVRATRTSWVLVVADQAQRRPGTEADGDDRDRDQPGLPSQLWRRGDAPPVSGLRSRPVLSSRMAVAGPSLSSPRRLAQFTSTCASPIGDLDSGSGRSVGSFRSARRRPR